MSKRTQNPAAAVADPQPIDRQRLDDALATAYALADIQFNVAAHTPAGELEPDSAWRLAIAIREQIREARRIVADAEAAGGQQ